MKPTGQMTIDDFIGATGWEVSGGSVGEMAKALNYFQKNVPAAVLNAPDNSSPWTPPQGKRTRLISWMQAISYVHPVVPNRILPATTRVKQIRFPGDSMSAKGDWFTWLNSDVDRMGLPDGQSAVRVFEVTRQIACMESRVADAFAGWTPKAQGRDYRHGGAVQLFVYRNGPAASALQLVGGAKPR